MDWLLADKSGEDILIDDYQQLMYQQFKQVNKGGQVGTIDLLVAKSEVNQL